MSKANDGPLGPKPRGAQPPGTEAYPLVFQKPRLSLLARFKSWFGIAPRPSPRTVPSVEREPAGGTLDVEPKAEQPKTERPETEQPETNREPIPIEESRAPSISVVREPDEPGAGDDTPTGPVLKETDRTVIPFPRRPTPVQRATLQMLPGRLLPVNAKVVQQEIRFLRSPRPEQSVTLGWEQGEPPDHITLHHPSIQLRHARMEYRKGHWWIQSLVSDDPVLLNGSALDATEGRRHLKNGDLVRLGQAEFRFLMP